MKADPKLAVFLYGREGFLIFIFVFFPICHDGVRVHGGNRRPRSQSWLFTSLAYVKYKPAVSHATHRGLQKNFTGLTLNSILGLCASAVFLTN